MLFRAAQNDIAPFSGDLEAVFDDAEKAAILLTTICHGALETHFCSH